MKRKTIRELLDLLPSGLDSRLLAALQGITGEDAQWHAARAVVDVYLAQKRENGESAAYRAAADKVAGIEADNAKRRRSLARRSNDPHRLRRNRLGAKRKRSEA